MGISMAQTPAQPQAPAQAQSPNASPMAPATPTISMQFTPGTLIRAKLSKTIDAKKAQVGDQVLAETTDDLKSVPPDLALKGCKIIGHIVEAVPHQGNAASTLKVVFEKMILKNGSEMELPANIQAVGFADQYDSSTSEWSNQRGGGSGNPGKYIGGRMPGGTAPSNPDAKLPFNAQGAIGMSGVTLSQGNAHDSVLTSEKHNVKLESGMQMILKTN